jgi:carbon storage regulator CsrA
MLVLSRKIQEKVLLPGIDASIQVLSIKGGIVRLGIDAPTDVAIVRAELQELSRQGKASRAAAPGKEPSSELRHVLRNHLNAAMVGLALLRRLRQLGRMVELDTTLDQLLQEIEKMNDDLERLGGKPAPPARPARRKALLVEDDVNERELLAGFLRLAGMEVATAGDGLDALDYLRNGEKPDVVLLDMGLPHCDGATTLQHIRRDPACVDLKVFALSGLPPAELGGEYPDTGINRWFQKPVNPEELLRALDGEPSSSA